MRTKEDALKTPIAGDRWRKMISGLCWSFIVMTHQDRKVRYLTSLGRKKKERVVSLKSFRKWAANAEYLGGPNDN